METPTPTSTPTPTPVSTPDFTNEDTDEDVREMLLNTDDNSPKEAAQNIERGKQYDMNPDDYNEMKDVLDPEADAQKRIPANVSETLKKTMRGSKQAAKVVEDDIGILETAVKQAKHVWYNLTEKHIIEGEIQELNDKGMNSENGLDDFDKEWLGNLYDQQQDEIEEFGLEGFEQAPGQMAGVVNDMFQAITKNINLVAVGAVTGGSIGLFSPTAPITGPAGFVAGGVLGATSAMALDAYKRVSRSSYGELGRMRKDDGSPLDLSHNMKQNISVSLGVIGYALESVTGHTLTAGLAKLASSKTATKYLVSNPLLKSASDVLGHTITSAGVGGTEELSGDIADMVSKEFAKGEKSVAGLANAMFVVAGELKKPETLKSLAQTFVVGAGASGGMAGASGALTLGKGKRGYEASNEALKIQRNIDTSLTLSSQAIDHQTGVLKFAALMEQTQMKKLSPPMTSEFVQDSLQEAGYVNNVWFTDEDIMSVGETNPEIAEKIREADSTGSTKSESGAPIGVKPHVFMELVGEMPSVSDHARLNPEAPNPLESRNLLDKRNEAETKRQEIFNSLGEGEQLSTEQMDTLEQLDKDLDESARKAGEQGFIDDEITFSDNMKDVLSDKDIEQMNEAERRTTEAVWLEVNQEFESREQRVENKVMRLNEAEIKREETELLREDNRIVNLFRNDKTVITESHKKKGYSPLAIDPSSLPDNLREAYVTEPTLKKRKVFVEGGLTLDEAAAQAGVATGEQLLRVLANTPSKKEVMAQRRKTIADTKKLVKESREVNVQERRDKVFDEHQKLNLKKLKVMNSKEWSTRKKGIKKIALPLPRIQELNNRASTVVKNTKVGELNAKQYLAGEKIKHKQAITQIVDNKVEESFIAIEEAMLNSELTRETLHAKDQVAKDKAFIKKLSDKSTQKSLKKAGLQDEVNEILNLFDLTGSKPKGERQASYFEYLESVDAKGETIIVPESLTDIRKRGSDLTVAQHRQISDRLRTLKHQAYNKNKFLKKAEGREKLDKIRTLESVVVEEVLKMQESPKYNAERGKAVRNQNSKTGKQKIVESISSKKVWLSNMKNVAVEADGELLGGSTYNLTAQPMVTAETFERTRNSEVVTHIKDIAKDYGEAEYLAAFNDEHHIPEFEGFPELGDGKMVKSDLWRMLMHLGDPGTKDRISNFKSKAKGDMDAETVLRVLERELTKQDVKLVQNFTNIFKTFEQEAKTLHENTTGVTPDMVKGISVEIHGIVMEGGYTPADSTSASSTEKATRYSEIMGDKKLSQFGEKKDNKLFGKLKSAEMTNQGRLANRTGSINPLDTDFRGIIANYEEHIHDIAYREAGTDVLNLLRNPEYAEGLISLVGEAKYDIMVSGVIETVGDINLDDTLSPFGKHVKDISSVVQKLESGFALAILGYKVKSVAMQALSIGSATLRMGPKGSVHLARTMGLALKDMGTLKYDKFFENAVDILPDLGLNLDSIDDSLTTSTYDNIIPERTTSGKTMTAVNKAMKKNVEFAMAGLKYADIHIKAIVATASYVQFMNGDVEGFSLEKINKMSEAERETKARNYVKQVADLALTTGAKIDKTVAEKLALGKLFTRFYQDTRAQLNTAASQIRKIDLSARKTVKSVKEGDYSSATSHAVKGAKDSASLFAIYALSNAYTDMLYSDEDDEGIVEQMRNVNDMEGMKDLMGRTLLATVTAPAKIIVGAIPVVRSIDYAQGSSSSRKTVSFPINRIFSDMSMTVDGLIDLYNDEELSDNQKRSMMYTASYFSKTGIPVSGPEQIIEQFELVEKFGDSVDFLKGQSGKLAQAISGFIKRNENKKGMEDDVEEAREVQKRFVPTLEQQTDIVTPEDSLEVLKMNEWNDLDPKTGGAGIYQFTEKAWNELSEKNPDLGLTEDGRVSKDTREQEAAMIQELDENTKGLTAYQVDVDNSSLYGAHRFGLEDYVMISLSKNNDKLKGLVENEELFEGFETVADVKRFIKKKLEGTDSNS